MTTIRAETTSFIAFAARIIRALGRRISSGDIDDLAAAAQLARQLDFTIATSISELRKQGFSWQDIADRLGTSRQAAQQRFGSVSA